MSQKIFLTGRPGIGKTTVIRKVVKQVKERNISLSGFYTQEIRENKRRAGFKIKGLNGYEGILAHVNLNTKYRVGKYSVKLEDIEECIEKLKETESDILVIDEIGKMELYSEKFKTWIENLLNSDKKVIGVIQKRISQKFKAKYNLDLMRVTEKNRNSLPNKIVKLLSF